MPDVAIVAGVRTPFGRAVKGVFRETRPEDLLVPLVLETLRRVPQVRPEEVEDLVVGCAMPEAEQGLNVARNVGFLAGLPDEVPALTVNRFCSSGLQAIALAAGRMALGEIDVALAGGVETMSLVPMGGNKTSLHPDLVERRPEAFTPKGITAERVARRFDVSRRAQDEFALESHARAVAAQRAGRFEGEIFPVDATRYDGAGRRTAARVAQDELPRADTTLERLAALKPSFDPGGTVTPGNSSPLTDGAALALVMTRAAAEARGVAPLGWLRAFAVVGVAPDVMGIGPVPAIRRLLSRTGKAMEEIDLFEVNEAFAAQAVHCARELKIPAEKLNVNGGAIALGHPLGATGARQVLTLLAELGRRGGRFGVVSMCIGGGMGAAALVERA